MISLSDLDNVPPSAGSSGVVTTSQTVGGTNSLDLKPGELLTADLEK
jgi:hypothetical protein